MSDAEPLALTVQGRRVTAGTGGTAFDPARPALLLLHGAGLDRSVWDAQATGLAARGRAVLAPDLPGHGGSDGPALPTIDALADWTAALIAAAGCDRAAVAGHSMGALAALACAARHPERVRALALLGAAARMPVHPDLLAAARDDLPRAAALIVKWGHGAAARGDPTLTGAAERLLAASAPGVLHTDLAACDAYADGTAHAAAAACPSLLVLGAEDRMAPPEAGRKLAERIPGARVVELPDSGHMLMAEAPDAVLDALAQAV
jgi:pimeloyl-ACP methyl ester carboxylesterase